MQRHNRIPQTARRRRKGRSGATIVETAITMLVMLTLVFGMLG